MTPRLANRVHRRRRCWWRWAGGAAGWALLALLADCSRTQPVPRVERMGTAHVERCLTCHTQTQGIGEAHAPSVVGCSPCHGGDPKAAEKDAAHIGMTVVVGGLAGIERSCGQAACHPVESARVKLSPMTTAAGIVAVDAFAFGERPTPTATLEDAFGALPERPAAPSQDHVRKLCGSCHLGAPKSEPGDQGFFARGGGCTACHLGGPVGELRAGQTPHPAVTAAVSDRRCEGCHARSGRISLSYRGIAEVEPGEATGKLPDGRPTARRAADVHARAGMGCLDCHSERDVMGDGRFHGHARDAVEVRCQDCHGRELRTQGASRDALQVAAVLRRSWQRRGLPSLDEQTPVVMQRGTPLYRTDVPSRSLRLAHSGERRELKPASDAAYHMLKGHARLSCQACHTGWAPRCTECHTERTEGPGFDHFLERQTPYDWQERAGGNQTGPAALAVQPDGFIGPFVEGMRMTLEGVGEPVHRVLWSPLDPHTTGPARSCESCHVSGKSELPTYPEAGETTRAGARLLDARERAKVQQVGTCLGCHAGYADSVYRDFSTSVTRLAARRRATESDPVRRCQGVLRALATETTDSAPPAHSP